MAGAGGGAKEIADARQPTGEKLLVDSIVNEVTVASRHQESSVP